MTPWESELTPWKSEREFCNFARGGLRRAWNKHPVKLSYLTQRRFKAPLGKKTKKNPNGMVWALVCEDCGETFRQSYMMVDHIKECGSFATLDDLPRFFNNLMVVTEEDIQALCKDCHDAKTYSERTGLSIEEARKEKAVIAYEKKYKKKLKEHLLKKGFSKEEVRNQETRRACIRRILC